MSSSNEEFLDAYNAELRQLGCEARVVPPSGIWHSGSFAIVSGDGTEIGVLPDTIEPAEMATVVRLLDRILARQIAPPPRTDSLER